MKEIDYFFKNYENERKKIKEALRNKNFPYIIDKVNLIYDYFQVIGRDDKLFKYLWEFNLFLRDIPFEYRKKFKSFRTRDDLGLDITEDPFFIHSMKGSTETLVDFFLKKEDFNVNKYEVGFSLKYFSKERNVITVIFADENYKYSYRINTLPNRTVIVIDETYFRYKDKINDHVFYTIEKKAKENRDTKIKFVTGNYSISILKI